MNGQDGGSRDNLRKAAGVHALCPPSSGRGRIRTIDAARGLGILLIVMGHVLRDGFFRQLLFTFSVPLFFLLSGAVYRYELPWKNFLRRRAVSLLLPYAAVSLLSIAVFMRFGKAAGRGLGEAVVHTGAGWNLAGMLYGNSRGGAMKWNEPLWFLPCLFVALLVCDLWERLLRRFGRRNLQAGRCVLVLLSFGAAWIWHRAAGDWSLPWSADAAIGMAAFLEMGIIGRAALPDAGSGRQGQLRTVCSRGPVRAVLIMLFFAAAAALSAWNGFAQVRDLNFGRSCGGFMLTSLFGCAGMLLLAFSVRKNRLLRLFGQKSLFILLFHKFPVVLFQFAVPGIRTLLRHGRTLPELLCAAAVALAVAAGCTGAALVFEFVFDAVRGRLSRYRQRRSDGCP